VCVGVCAKGCRRVEGGGGGWIVKEGCPLVVVAQLIESYSSVRHTKRILWLPFAKMSEQATHVKRERGRERGR